MSAPSKQLFYTLDALRGAAALLVVQRHATGFFGDEPFSYSYLAVDLFFLMSGFVLEQAYGARLLRGLPSMKFMWLRIVRLYPAYLLGFVLGVAAYAIALAHPALAPSGTEPELTYPLLSVALGAAMLPTLFGASTLYPFNDPSWSLSYELFINAAFAVFYDRLSNRAIAAICAMSGVALGIAAWKAGQALDYGWTVHSLPLGLARVTFSFSLGVGLYRWRVIRAGAKFKLIKSDLLAMSITLLPVGALMMPGGIFPHGVYDLLVVFLVFPIVVIAASFIQPGRRFTSIFQVAGLTSYAIYVLHVPIYRLLEQGIREVWDGASDLNSALPQGCFLLALFTLCYVVDKNYDLPLRRWLIARFRSRRDDARPVRA